MLWSELRLIFKTSSVTPDFFTLLILSYHFLPSVKVLKKSVCGKFLGANVLKQLERRSLEKIRASTGFEPASVNSSSAHVFQRATELTECAVLLAILELNVPALVSVVVAPDLEVIKVAEVLMVEEGILGVHEVTVEEVVVVEGHKKQTLWLTGISAKNLPDRFSIVPSLHSLWSS